MSYIRGSSLLSEENPALVKPSGPSNVFVDLMSSTFYTVMGYVCLDIVFAISLHFISQHNSANAMAGLGLAFTTVNVLLIPMALGTNQSLNVHSAQALGAKKNRLAHTYFSLTLILHLIYFIPIAVIILAMKTPIAMTINPADRAETSDDSQMYLYFLLPSSFFAILYEAIKSYMIAHKVFSLFMYVQLVTTSLHILWCYLFIDIWDIGGGIPGAGLAIILTEFLNCLLLITVILFSSYKNTVFENYSFRFSFAKHKKIFISFTRTSFPIIAHIYADYFVFFLLNFIAVSFGSNQLNAQLALSNTSNVYYKFPISLSLALMTFIGNEMGQKNIPRAKKYAMVGVVFFVLFTTVFLTLLTVFKTQWQNIVIIFIFSRASFYAENDYIRDLILDVYPIFAFGFFIIDGLQGTLTGILKGIERKEFVTYSTLFVYYLIGIPLVVYYSYDLNGFGLDQKVYGIWFAFAIVNAVLALLYMVLTFTTNWKRQSDLICERVEKQHKMQNLDDSLNKEFDDDVENGGSDKKKKKIKRKKIVIHHEYMINDYQVMESTDKERTGSSQSSMAEQRQLVKDQQALRGDEGSLKDNMSLQQQQQRKSRKSSQYSLPGEKRRQSSNSPR